MSAVDDILLDQGMVEQYGKLTPHAQAIFNWQYKWLQEQAHKHQIEPPGDWWNIWLMLAGRGAGKTRLGPNHRPAGWFLRLRQAILRVLALKATAAF